MKGMIVHLMWNNWAGEVVDIEDSKRGFNIYTLKMLHDGSTVQCMHTELVENQEQ